MTLFYGLFVTLYEIQFGGSSISGREKVKPISNEQILVLRQADADLDNEAVPPNVIGFVFEEILELCLVHGVYSIPTCSAIFMSSCSLSLASID